MTHSTLYCGDCLDLIPQIPGDSFDLVVMDPPYMFTIASCGSGKLNPWADLCNGARFFTPLYQQIKERLPADGALWTFLNWRTLPAVQKAAFDAGWSITSLMVWDKQCIGPGGMQGLRPSYEMVALMCQPEFKLTDRGIKDIKSWKWSSHRPTGHPAEKPLGLIRWIIDISKPKRGVLDPFLGSGTVGVACAEMNIPFVGIEIDEKWFGFAKQRIAGMEEVPQGK